MIRIRHNDLFNVNRHHFKGVNEWIKSTIIFYINIFEILSNVKNVNQYNADMHYYKNIKTLRTHLNILLKCPGTNYRIQDMLMNRGVNTFKEVYLNNIPMILEFLKDIHKNTRIIIMGKPHRLEKFYINLVRMYEIFTIANLTNHTSDFDYEFIDDFKNILQRIFNYDLFIDKIGFTYGNSKKWDAYSLAEELDVGACPYCNRISIVCVIDKSNPAAIKKITRSEFDHFICKSTHPIFALSFYNLIPSCSPCNSDIKNVKKFTIQNNVNPYIQEFGDNSKFGYVPLDYSAFHGNKDEIEVELKTEACDLYVKIEDNIQKLELRNVYKEYNYFVCELVCKWLEKFNRSYKNSLINLLSGNLSDSEIFDEVFGKQYDEIAMLREPLSKLKNDIIENLKTSEHPFKSQ